MAHSAAGTQFDVFDKAVAARFFELYARPFIYRQDYDEWITIYNQLAAYARANGDDSYVARQWRDEEPRYRNAPSQLLSKVRIADPKNYDTAISVSGGCNCSKLAPITNSPVNFGPLGGDNGMLTRGYIPAQGSTFAFGFPTGSVGDAARNLFSPSPIPYVTNPVKQLAADVGKETMTGILVAICVGAILWGIHHFTKKKVPISA